MLRLIDTLLPDECLHSPEEQRRGRLLVASLFAIFIVCLFFGLQMHFVGRYPVLNELVLFAGCGLAVVNLLLLRQTRSVTLPGVLFCLEAVAIIAFQAYNDLGLSDPAFVWYAGIPWLAAILIRPKYGFVFAGLVAATLSGFYVLELRGHPFPAYTDQDMAWLSLLLQLSALALYIGFMGWFYEGQTLRKMRGTNRELRVARDALHASNERLERMLESISDGFFSLDEEGRISYLNHRAERFFGEKRATLLGSRAGPHLLPHLDEAAREKLRAAVQGTASTHFSLYHTARQRWFELRVYPFSEGRSVYFKDVTERKEYEQGLIEARERAEELARMKDTFMANMSHEVRTPLTSIIGFSNVLAEKVDGEHREFAGLIERSAKRLLNMLSGVLELSQLEGGEVEPEREHVNVAAEVGDAVRLFEQQAQERGLYLRTRRIATDASALIDPGFLHRILNNLLANALKFTEEGGVSVEIDGDAHSLYLRVADTGIGISPDFVPHVFEEFRQESTGLSRSHVGGGLGLYLTRELVEALDGTIEVESEKDVGTVFSVHLPRNVTAPQKAMVNTEDG